MNSVRQWIRNVFGFTSTEINGFIILIPIMVVCVFSEPFYRRWTGVRGESPENALAMDSVVRHWTAAHASSDTAKRFGFNPNTAPVADLRKLGFSEVSSTRIAAYRQKGGVFRVKSDLLNIYGLDSTLYKQLYAFIELPAAPPELKPAAAFTRPDKRWKAQQPTPDFDINTADTLQLKSVYGIGSRLAARIVKFRDALGGFVHIDQLYEVYGLDSTVVKELQEKSFIKNGFMPRKIDINSATEKDLAAHPYIRFKLARLLVSYRFQHGDFMQPNDIKKLSALAAPEVDRLLPYLKANVE